MPFSAQKFRCKVLLAAALAGLLAAPTAAQLGGGEIRDPSYPRDWLERGVRAKPVLPVLTGMRIGGDIYFFRSIDCGIITYGQGSASNILVHVALKPHGSSVDAKVDSWTDRSGNVHTADTLRKQVALAEMRTDGFSRPVSITGVMDRPTLLGNKLRLSFRAGRMFLYFHEEAYKPGIDPRRKAYLEAWMEKVVAAMKSVEKLEDAIDALPKHPSAPPIQVNCDQWPSLDGVAGINVADDPDAGLIRIQGARLQVQSSTAPDEWNLAEVIGPLTPDAVENYMAAEKAAEKAAVEATAEAERIGFLLFDLKPVKE